MGQFLYLLSSIGITYTTIDAYMALYRWPARIGTLSGKAAFKGNRAKNSAAARIFKCTASEGLSIIYVMAQYVRAGVALSADAVTRSHALCFLLLFNIVCLIESSSRKYVDPNVLAASVDAYLELYLKLYGDSSMIKTFHWLHHFAIALRRWGKLPSCFSLERKHRIPKRYANNIRNTHSTFDSSCSREVTCYHLSRLRGDNQNGFGNLTVGRIGKTHTRINAYEVVKIGDVVLFLTANGEMAAGAIVALPTAVAATVASWSLIHKDFSVSRWSARAPVSVIVPVASILAACIYALADHVATVLHPSRC